MLTSADFREKYNGCRLVFQSFITFTLHTCTRGEVHVIGHLSSSPQNSRWSPCQRNQTIDIKKKTCLKCTSNHSARPTSITNSVFLLVMVATPIDLSHFPSVHVHNWPSRDQCDSSAGVQAVRRVCGRESYCCVCTGGITFMLFCTYRNHCSRWQHSILLLQRNQ